MDFELPADLKAYLAELDAFIEAEIKPLQAEDDNGRFFDHRREWARTDFEGHDWRARASVWGCNSLRCVRTGALHVRFPMSPGS